MNMNRLQNLIREKTAYINEMFNNMKSDNNKPKEPNNAALEKDGPFEKRLSEIKIMIVNMQKKIDNYRKSLPLGDATGGGTKETIDITNVNNVLPIIVKSQTPLTISKISYKTPDAYNDRYPEKKDESIRRHFSELWDDFDAVNDSYARNNENNKNAPENNYTKDDYAENKDEQGIVEKSEKQSDADSTDLIDLNNVTDIFDTSDTLSVINDKQKEFEEIVDPLSANQSSNSIEIKVDQKKFEKLFNDLCLNSPYYSVYDEHKFQDNFNQVMLNKNDPLHLIDSDMD